MGTVPVQGCLEDTVCDKGAGADYPKQIRAIGYEPIDDCALVDTNEYLPSQGWTPRRGICQGDRREIETRLHLTRGGRDLCGNREIDVKAHPAYGGRDVCGDSRPRRLDQNILTPKHFPHPELNIDEELVPGRPVCPDTARLQELLIGRENSCSGIPLVDQALSLDANNQRNSVEYANVLLELGLSGRGLPLFEAARATFEASGATTNTNYGRALMSIGTVYLEKGNFDDALSKYHLAQAVFDAADAKTSTNYAELMARIGEVRCHQGDSEGALQRYENAMSYYEAAGVSDGMGLVRLWCLIGDARLGCGQREAAKAAYLCAMRSLRDAGLVEGKAGQDIRRFLHTEFRYICV